MKFPPLAVAGLLAIAMIAAPITAVALTSDDDARERSGNHARDDRSGPGRAHAQQMKEWARCVAEARRGQQDTKSSPVEACGEKPAPPGHAKRGDRDDREKAGKRHGKADKADKAGKHAKSDDAPGRPDRD